MLYCSSRLACATHATPELTINNAIIIIARRFGEHVTAFILGHKRIFDIPPVAKEKQISGDTKGVQGLGVSWGKEEG